MKHMILRLTIAALAAAFLFVGLLSGETERKADIPVPSAPWNGNVNIHIRSANAQRQADGRYLVEVVFTTDTAEDPSDLLVATVFGREQTACFLLTEENREKVHEVRFTEAVQPEQVRVEVCAHETEAGLLLVTDDDGQLCGEAIAPVDGDRVLALSGAAPGADYHFYRVAELGEFLSGTVKLSLRPTEQEITSYAINDNHVLTVSAEADGTASANFSQARLADGVYLAVGEGNAFYVCLPQVEASGELRASSVRICVKDKE